MLTAVALCWDQQIVAEIVDVARDAARARTDEIERYVATGEPFDKAGAYAVQGRAAVVRLAASTAATRA